MLCQNKLKTNPDSLSFCSFVVVLGFPLCFPTLKIIDGFKWTVVLKKINRSIQASYRVIGKGHIQPPEINTVHCHVLQHIISASLNAVDTLHVQCHLFRPSAQQKMKSQETLAMFAAVNPLQDIISRSPLAERAVQHTATQAGFKFTGAALIWTGN